MGRKRFTAERTSACFGGLKSMKALFISYNGALEPLMQSQGIPYLKGLSCKGVKCFLLTFEKASRRERYFKEKINKLKGELKDNNIKWNSLKYHKNPTFPATIFDIFMGIIIGLNLIVSKKIDIIHARATVPAVIGFVLAKLTGKKFLFDVRGLMAEEYVDGGIWRRGSLLYKLTLFFEKYLLCRADFLVVLSENIKIFLMKTDYLSKHYRGKKPDIAVIPCCVDLERFNRLNSSVEQLRKKHGLTKKFVFLYIGSLGTWYLLDEMIDFFLAAKTIIHNAHFFILTQSDKKIVKNAWKKRNLSFDEITIEEAEFEDMPSYINLADVGIFFIKPVFSKRFSSPTKFAEYLACGLPVSINAGIGDTDGVVEKHKIGVVIDEFSRESYLSKINNLMEMMKDKNLLSEKCHWVAENKFSLKRGIAQYYYIYSKLFSRIEKN